MSDPLPASAPGDGDTVAVERDDAQHRFTVTGDAGVAELVYRLRPGEIEFLHTGLVPRLPTGVLSTGLMLLGFLSLACGLILDAVSRGRKENKRLAYLAIPPLETCE